MSTNQADFGNSENQYDDKIDKAFISKNARLQRKGGNQSEAQGFRPEECYEILLRNIIKVLN